MAEQGTTYIAFIDEQLEQERKRREALDARGLAVLTTTSALVAVLFALTVLVTGKDFTVVKNSSAVLVIVSVALLLAAGVLGILANRLGAYKVASLQGLSDLLTTQHWKDSEVTARSITAQNKLVTISSLRSGNDDKVKYLERALVLQMAGIAALVIAVRRETVALL